MFDLDTAVAKWNEELSQKLRFEEHEIDELQDHLLCEIEKLRKKDYSEEKAFTLATAKIGANIELSRELLKVSFVDRLRRLPRNLLSVAILFILVGVVSLPLNFLGLLNALSLGVRFSIVAFAAGATAISIFNIMLGIGIFYLRPGYRLLGLIVSVYFLFMLPAVNIYRILMISQYNGPLRLNFWGEFIVNDRSIGILIFSLHILVFSTIYFWIARVLNISEIKLLFGLTNEKNGLIKQPLKTFKRLPY